MSKIKIIAVVAAIILSSLYSEAKFIEKPEDVRPFEAELFYGFGTGFNYHRTHSDGAATIGLEMRGNLRHSAFDVGGFLRFDGTGYNFSRFQPADAYYYDSDQTNMSFSIGAVSHYNFRQGRKVNPFAGLGIGMAVYATEGHDFEHAFPTDGVSVVFYPKIGVELFSWVRFTAYGTFLRKGYNNVGLSVGLTIGGWRKSAK